MMKLFKTIEKNDFIFKIIQKINQYIPVYGIPVLLYHRIGTENDCKQPGPCRLIREFDKEMGYLKKNNYSFINIEDLLKYISDKTVLPDKSILITFDDGYKDNYRYAFSIIKKYQAKATIFLNTNFIGRKVPLQVGGNIFNEVIPEKADAFYDFLSWDEIKEMDKEGIDFQAHGHFHPNLTQIGDNEIIKEIRQSKKILEKNLRKDIYYFSYPFGLYNKKIISILQKEGFKASFTVKPGIVKTKGNVWTLPRTDIKQGISFGQFKAILSDHIRWYTYIKMVHNKYFKNVS